MLASAAEAGPAPHIAPCSAPIAAGAGPTAAHPHAPPACWHGGCGTAPHLHEPAQPHGASDTSGAAAVEKGRRVPHVVHEQ